MRVSGTVFAGLLLFAAKAALAQPGYEPAPSDAAPSDDTPAPMHGSGFSHFVGLRGSLATDSRVGALTALPAPLDLIRASYDTGGGGSMYIGTRLPLGFRVELEGLYRYQSLRDAHLNGTAIAGATGNSQIAAPMVNLLWELPVADEYWVHPYVGMGVGAAYVKTDVTDGTTHFLRHDDWALAWSMMAGASVSLSDSSRFTAMYRIMQVRETSYGCVNRSLTSVACLDTSQLEQGVDLGIEMDL